MLPRGRRAASSAIAEESIRTSSFPGKLVPPPPRKRETAPTARARASFGPSVGLIVLRGRIRCKPGREKRIRTRAVTGHKHVHGSADRAHAQWQLADRVAVGVHRERAIRADGDLARPENFHAG